MRHERDFLGPSFDMESPIERGSYRSTTLWWAGVFISGALFWIAVAAGIRWAFSI